MSDKYKINKEELDLIIKLINFSNNNNLYGTEEQLFNSLRSPT